jgi:hypothetical protein
VKAVLAEMIRANTLGFFRNLSTVSAHVEEEADVGSGHRLAIGIPHDTGDDTKRLHADLQLFEFLPGLQ